MTLLLVCVLCAALDLGALYFLWYWDPETMETYRLRKQHARLRVDIRAPDILDEPLTTDTDWEGLV